MSNGRFLSHSAWENGAAASAARILMILLLLMPLYGPWLNANFAAGQPFHDHIYLDRVKVHGHAANQPNDVVNLPSQESLSNNVPLLQPLASPAVTPPSDDSNLTSTLVERSLRLESAYLPLPDKPPRA